MLIDTISEPGSCPYLSLCSNQKFADFKPSRKFVENVLGG